MERQHREVVVIEERRRRRIMWSSASPSQSSSTVTSKKNSGDSESVSPSPSSQDSAASLTQLSLSSSPPPSKAPPPSSLPQSSPPPPPTEKSNPPPSSPSPPPPSSESELPVVPESSEPPTTTESQPELPPPTPPLQSGSVQTLSTSGSYSPLPPSLSTSSLPLEKSPSSTASSSPTLSNDIPPPSPPIASTATDASPNPTTQSTTSLGNGTTTYYYYSNETSSSNSTPTSSSSTRTSHSGAVGVATVGAVAGVFIILLLVILFLFIRGKRKIVGHYTNSDQPPPADQKNNYGENMVLSGEHAPNSFGSQQGGNMYHGGGPEIGGSKNFFSYEELMEITSGFSHQNIIGEGGFGCVFRGQLPDGRAVAVKQLKVGSGQGEREFRAEVDIITRVHHRHLVSLVGYCIAQHRRLLIYEFVPNKTLEHHLHGNEMPVLEWTKRLKIALGSAKGLAYLHEDCHPKIIHRDIKSANILLDDAFEAQVADFGLAKLTNDANTHVSTRVMGTFGYLAPEYASSGKLTDRSDVFSFGVVLLELLTGRKPVDSSQPLGDESLVEWARPRLVVALESGDFSELVDPRLGKSYVESELVRMMEAAAACIRHSAPKRPRMAQVVRALDCDEELSDLSNGVKYGESTLYNSDQYSQDIVRFRRTESGDDDDDDDSSEVESTALKPPSNNNQTSWKSPESSIRIGKSYGHELDP